MFDLPLHPKIVHLPIALSVVLPLLASGILLSWWRAWLPRRGWLVVVGIQFLLVAGGYAALLTGGNEGERVETVVSEAAVEAHEEAAEQFVWASAVVLLVLGAALVPRRDSMARLVAALGVAASVGLLVLAVRTGEAGGKLVYRHGAANAWIATAAAPPAAPAAGGPRRSQVEDD